VRDVATLPVIVLPLRPNEIPFELLNTIALRLFDVVPPERLIAVSDVATLAVMADPALVPNEIPLTLENERVWNANPPFAAVTF
jgi:hypothetical protein